METISSQPEANSAFKRKFPNSCSFLPKWLSFCKFNKFIEGVDIIPFKCPLQPKFDSHLHEEERFPFELVYNFSIESHKPITDVIDLTNTDKYYESTKDNFFPPGVQHHKFNIPGKEIPNKKTLDHILDVMDTLIKEKRVIGIHCTHGINRTGYIVCTFLVRRLGWNPKTSIDEFEKARGHEIAYPEYIEAISNPEGTFAKKPRRQHKRQEKDDKIHIKTKEDSYCPQEDHKSELKQPINQRIADHQNDFEKKIPGRKFPNNCSFLPKWLSFCKFNKFIEGVDIIPFKCPLQPKFDSHLHEEERFPFELVYNFSIESHKPITDVIDLTNTDKYYESTKDNFFPPGVQHHKFNIPGKEIPNKKTLDHILDVMDTLIKEKRVIGIHCTHGINRTGYIVCTFLVRRLGWNPNTSIDEFQKARGHEIAYPEYIEAISNPEGNFVKKPRYQRQRNQNKTQFHQQIDQNELQIKNESNFEDFKTDKEKLGHQDEVFKNQGDYADNKEGGGNRNKNKKKNFYRKENARKEHEIPKNVRNQHDKNYDNFESKGFNAHSVIQYIKKNQGEQANESITTTTTQTS